MTMASRRKTAQTSKQREADETVKEMKKFLLRFLHGYGKGVALYCGFKAIMAITKNPFSHGLSVIPGQVFSWDCARFATFLGLYPSVYQLLVKQLKKYTNKNGGWNYGLAGCLAGLSVIVEDKGRRRLFSLFAFVGAVGARIATLVSRDHISKVLYIEIITFFFALYNMDQKSLANKRIFNRVPFGTVVLFCLSMMVLMHAYKRQPHTLTPQLVKGLLEFFVGKRTSQI